MTNYIDASDETAVINAVRELEAGWAAKDRHKLREGAPLPAQSQAKEILTYVLIQPTDPQDRCPWWREPIHLAFELNANHRDRRPDQDFERRYCLQPGECQILRQHLTEARLIAEADRAYTNKLYEYYERQQARAASAKAARNATPHIKKRKQAAMKAMEAAKWVI